ncbi:MULTISPECIES: response regulator transcription factor [Shouchella]|uniref:Transcriptional regulatory protein DesR n=4 Tax=Shouchella TaxID=2893057 RepID=A0A060LT00_9BACI|nr:MULTISPECIES: response regulator transcription factor [Shouchella]RQW22823.1 DNA-binding response regulator [Bacillus sp. C1-1]AIC93267.1 transcriptional regulatory protein DesR [Shouchella lehensis G1]MBG9782968.1 transcriptional regulatory protein DesR [Shouchella lehensis]MED4129803.1 response regulator transcription factor [Shouchella miscanthi]TES49676.1 response regulator transcription factor [Shouchella lehensis]
MIRIVIAEDQGMVLGALASLLELEADMTVVGKAKTGVDAVALVKQVQPDICIMDIEMPLMTGIEAAEQLKEEACKIIILTTFARTGYFNYARAAGVSGYLLKDSPSDELARAIRTILDGRKVYAPELMDMIDDSTNPLTDREGQVIQLIAEGKSTKEVADHLNIKTGTVRNYVSVIYEKLNVTNRIEAISLIQEKGWYK